MALLLLEMDRAEPSRLPPPLPPAVLPPAVAVVSADCICAAEVKVMLNLDEVSAEVAEAALNILRFTVAFG